MNNIIFKYFNKIFTNYHHYQLLENSFKGENLQLPETIDLFINKSQIATSNGKKLMFIGNGGSSIASHMAEDF